MLRTMPAFLAELDRYTERIPLSELAAHLQALDIALDDVAEFLCFGENTYRRNLMHAGPAYQALILCWRSGQRSPIHDHRGSSCGVRVLSGVATEVKYGRSTSGALEVVRSCDLLQGQVCATQDMDIHEMSNLKSGAGDLVTLHIYSPPLKRMGTYTLDGAAGGDFNDPVFDGFKETDTP